MAIEITRCSNAHLDSVRDFNRRLASGGEGVYVLPEALEFFEKSAEGPLPWEMWVALMDGVVRGGYVLRRQDFRVGTETLPVVFYRLSPSEGSIDRKYAPVSMKMLTDLVRREPLVFALGMGGISSRLPQFLKALGWRLHEIPFFFRAVRPGRVLRNIQTVRATPARRLAADVAALSGAATVGLWAIQTWKRIASGRARQGGRVEVVPEFGAWADDIWEATRELHSMVGVRDSRALNEIYSGVDMQRIERLRVYAGDRPVGWAVVLHTQMSGDKHFGNLHVGTLVDCLACEADAALVAEAAERYLEDRGVDLIVSNQSHEVWRRALLDRGYFQGPSNYALAISKAWAARLQPVDPELTRIHVTRGDGDGPINL